MKRNLLIVTAVLFVVLLLGGYFFYKKSQTTPLPLPNEAEWTKEMNRQMQESFDQSDKFVKENAAEISAKQLAFAAALKLTQEIGDRSFITFYGKVVDQNNQPVSNAKIFYDAYSPHYQASGRAETKTDAKGFFAITDATGSTLFINDISKPDIQFKSPTSTGFSIDPKAEEFFLKNYVSPETAYVFEAWKIEGGYPKTSHAKSTYGFESGNVYSMDFFQSNSKQVKHLGRNDSFDLQVTFVQKEDSWTLELFVPDGGLLESDDLYMNLAPEAGYQQTLHFRGTRKDHMIPKNYYIKSRGNTYGRLLVEIRPWMNRGSALGVDHVMNLETGRSLVVKSD